MLDFGMCCWGLGVRGLYVFRRNFGFWKRKDWGESVSRKSEVVGRCVFYGLFRFLGRGIRSLRGELVGAFSKGRYV